ncbi:MAG: Sec1 domain containing protein 1, partial [Paramarteilia canceri]
SLKLNRVSGVPSDDSSSTKLKSFDILPDDKFWESCHEKILPHAFDQITEELNQYKEKDKALRSLNNTLNQNGYEVSENSNNIDLKAAVNNLPELIRVKRELNTHFELISSLGEIAEKRRLDLILELEDKILQKKFSYQFLDEIYDFLESDTFQNEDKFRVALIFIMQFHQNLSPV